MDLLESLQRLGDAEHDDIGIAHDALSEIVRLRLLVAEQEGALYGLRAEVERLRAENNQSRAALEVDINHLRAEVEALKPLLAEAANELIDSYEIMYPTRERWPDEMRRYERDMDLVKRIHAALCGEGEK